MKYLIYTPNTGAVFQYLESPDILTQSPIDGTEVLEIADRLNESLERYTIVNGEVVLHPPIEPKATTADIKDKWLQLEQAPVEIFNGTVDCDPLSELRMKSAIDNWNVLPNIEGQLETIDGVRKIYWKMITGTVALSLSELENVYSTMLEQRAIRAAILFSNYQRIKSLPSVSLSYIQDKTNWFK